MSSLSWFEPDLLRPAGVRLFWSPCPVGAEADDRADRRLLAPDEEERAARFRKPEHARSFRHRRAFLRRVLGQALDRDPASLAFTVGPHGKPALVGAPLWFNASESQGHTLVGISERRELGVDLELPLDLRDLDRLVRRIFSEDERAVWRGLADSARPAAFYRVWSRKEAILKATGEGLTRDPAAFTVGCEARPREAATIALEGQGELVQVDLELPIDAPAALAVRRA